MSPVITSTRPAAPDAGSTSARRTSQLVASAMRSIERVSRRASERFSRQFGRDTVVVADHDTVRVRRLGDSPTVHLDGTAAVDGAELPVAYAYRPGHGWLIWIRKDGGYGAVRSPAELDVALAAARS